MIHCHHGIKNFGSTCYANTIFQCLAATVEFREYLISGMCMGDLLNNLITQKGNKWNDISNGMTNSVTYKLREFMLDMCNDEKKDVVVDPAKQVRESWKVSVKGKDEKVTSKVPDGQQDCEEFLTFILTSLHEELKTRATVLITNNSTISMVKKSIEFWKTSLESEHSPITDLFTGITAETTECKGCNNAVHSPTIEYITKIDLTTNNCKTLNECLKKKYEDTPTEDYICENCVKVKRTPTTPSTAIPTISKATPILLPNILIYQFIRTEADENKKNLTEIECSCELDMSKYVHENCKQLNGCMQYELYAISQHIGDTVNDGHYVAIVKENGNWYECNDTNVKPTNSVVNGGITSKHTYVLFYKKKGTIKINSVCS